MQLIATDKTRLSHTLKHEYDPSTGFTREVVTYNGAAKTFAIGDLVTSAGVTAATAATIYGVVLEDKSAALNTATQVVVLRRGPAIVSKAGIQLGAIVAADAYTQLATMGIVVADAV